MKFTTKDNKIPRIKTIKATDDMTLIVTFDSGVQVIYDVKDDIANIKDFSPLENDSNLFKNFQLDKSRTCVYWSDRIDLPSDTILEYGKVIDSI